MKRFALASSLAALLLISTPHKGGAVGAFDQKLSPDRQILQALNRLSFGPRPGDVEEVRRLGVAKWIDLQLHPERVAENPALEAKLKPLESLRMSPPEVARDYSPQQVNAAALIISQPLNLNTLLSPDELRKVLNGAAEERTTVLKSLDPAKRKQVLGVLPTNLLEFTPEFKQEAADAVKMRQEDIQKELRKRNPQLTDMLTQEQVQAARSGNKDQLEALFAYLDPDKRALVAGLLPAQSLAMMPELRRMGQMQRQARQVPGQDAKEGKVFRAIYSNHQLEEVLVDFWYNHFNVDLNKNVQNAQNLEQVLIGSYERDAIRPYVLGHFKDMLLATARHPAMLVYLDNWQSMAPGSFEVGPFAPQRGIVNGVPNSIIPNAFSRQAHGLNENYGREIMELHTLGVKGGYTQDDVIAVARSLTGWTIRDPNVPEFVFASFMHDAEEKIVLGQKIAPAGQQEGVQVINILAHHPSTAKFISRELAQRFVADDPPQALIDRMAQTFTKTDGDLRAVLETMFTSAEFFSEGAWQAKIKSPFEMVVSAVRAVGAEASDTFTLVQKIADMGQPLYGKLEPTGYPNTGETWLSTTGVLGRLNFSSALASGLIPGIKLNLSRLEAKDEPAIAREILGREASEQTNAAILQGLAGRKRTPAFITSLVLGSPDFQRR
ncbi:MAG: DUF1800 domain-containing protein [Acidobacteriota bacterium]